MHDVSHGSHELTGVAHWPHSLPLLEDHIPTPTHYSRRQRHSWICPRPGMGCSPFGSLISKAFGGSKKRPSKWSRRGRCREYSPHMHTEHAASQPMSRTLIYIDDGPVSLQVAQPVHTVQAPTATVQMMDNQHLNHPPPEADISPSPHALAAGAEKHQTWTEDSLHPAPGDVGYQPQPHYIPITHMAAGPAHVYRSAPSPVPTVQGRADQLYGERRKEYFGGEYRYSYPTPVREGIYRMATDANRLTTMFSDENPNACSIA